MKHDNSRIIGSIIVIIGLILFANHYNLIHFDVWSFWPLILVYYGWKSESDYRHSKNPHKLLTGATLFGFGFYFLIDALWGNPASDILWPMFIIAPGLGFLHMAYNGHHPKRNFRKGIIISLIAIAFFIDEVASVNFDTIIYVVIILFGLLLLTKNKFIDEPYDSQLDDEEDYFENLDSDSTSFQYGFEERQTDKVNAYETKEERYNK